MNSVLCIGHEQKLAEHNTRNGTAAIRQVYSQLIRNLLSVGPLSVT
jgi:hypothetical protein